MITQAPQIQAGQQPDDLDVIDVAENETVIEERYADLPDDVAATVSDPNLMRYINRVGQKTGLSEDQTSMLFFFVERVLSGALPQRYFTYVLTQALHVSEELTESVASIVKKELFAPIAGSLASIERESPLIDTEKIIALIKHLSQEDASSSEEFLLLRILSLPRDVQHAIFSPEPLAVYATIRERYALDDAQQESLATQTHLLLLGATAPKEYVLVLAEKLGIPRDKAAFIAQEVNRNILHRVRESLKEVHMPVEEQTITVSQPSIQAPTVETATPIMTPTPPPAIPPSVLNQKLGAAFRVPTPPQAPVPNYTAPTPFVPPAPPAPTVEAPRAKDPYRELPM